MKLEKTCQCCLWYDQCGASQICDFYFPLDDSYVGKEYEADLHMSAEEYQGWVDEINENA